MKIGTADFFDLPQSRPLSLVDRLPYLILPACIIFNFILCFINTRVFTISVPMIIACEMILVTTSVLYGFFRINRVKLYWLMIIVVQIGLMLILSLARDELMMKPIRDMIIMPVFVVLGLASARVKPINLLFWLSGLIAFFALYEGYFLESFTQYFNIRRYYVEKGVLSDDFFIPLELSASGMRPNARFLVDLPFHRLSSVFLEPVSLGFFGFIVGLYFTAVKKQISLKIFLAGLACAYFMILVSDARMAFGTLTLVLALRPLFSRIDHRFSILIFPIILTVGFIIYITQIFGTTGEGIGWRINDAMTKLSVMDFDLFMGLSTYRHHAEDSALLKTFQYQGILGVLIFWLVPIFCMRRLAEAPKIYLYGITFFLGFGFLVSSAILTIKTAALLWFLYGYLIVRSVEDYDPQNTAETVAPQGDISGRSV